MKGLAILAVLVASACGVDGPPERPAAAAQAAPRTPGQSSVALSGHATVGVVSGL